MGVKMSQKDEIITTSGGAEHQHKLTVELGNGCQPHKSANSLQGPTVRSGNIRDPVQCPSNSSPILKSMSRAGWPFFHP